MRKKQAAIICGLSLCLAAGNLTYAAQSGANTETEVKKELEKEYLKGITLAGENAVEHEFAEVSVHDPS
ncbi:hypothetical protein RFZ45_07405, partial [Acinetobacter baumannii]|nr:hypothetical protein [Acinetobacter baumannii]